TAWTTTPSTAIAPSHRSHTRVSFTNSSIASNSVNTPSPPAANRCENSKKSPPCSELSAGTHTPCDFGQSVTETAPSFDATTPTPRLLYNQQHRHQQRKHSQPAGSKPVRKLKKVPALQRTQRRDPHSVRLRPVGHRKRRIFRRHQRPGHKKQDRPTYSKNREP